MKNIAIFGFIVILVFASGIEEANAQREIIISSTKDTPYIRGRIAEFVGKRVECALKKMNRKFQYKLLPSVREEKEVEINKSHAFFPGSINERRKIFSVPSVPIFGSKGIWIMKASSNLKPDTPEFITAKKGYMKGTGSFDRAKKEYPKGSVIGAQTNKQLFEMLGARRFETVRSSEVRFQTYLLEQKKTDDDYQVYTASVRMQSIFFGKLFLNEEPTNFMDKFNTNLEKCIVEIPVYFNK